MDHSEKTIQRRLTYLGLATIASVPFLGPGMLFGTVGVFAGKFIRKLQNRDPKESSTTTYSNDERPKIMEKVYSKLSSYWSNIQNFFSPKQSSEERADYNKNTPTEKDKTSFRKDLRDYATNIYYAIFYPTKIEAVNKKGSSLEKTVTQSSQQ